MPARIRAVRAPLHRAVHVSARLMIGLAAAFVLPARAELFTCNVGGRTYSGDQPPVECGSVVIRVLNPDGSVRRTIDPPLTREQVRQREIEEAKARQAEEERRAQLRHDRALLETYANEDEILAARDRALSSRQQVIERAQSRLEEHRNDRRKLDAETEFYVKRSLPPQLKHAIDVNDDLQHKEEKVIADMTVEMQRIRDRFDGERSRFRELMAAGATARRN